MRTRSFFAVVVIIGLIGHVLADDVSRSEQRRAVEPLARSVVRIEIERGVGPWQWPGLDAIRSETLPLARPTARVEPTARDVAAGVFIDRRLVLACLPEDPGLLPRLRVTLGKEKLGAMLRARDRATGLALIEVEDPPAAVAPVVFVERRPARVAVPTPVGLRSVRVAATDGGGLCSTEPLLPGSPVLASDGEVVGLVERAGPALAPLVEVAPPCALGKMIPADVLPDLARQLESRGEIARGWLGATLRALDPFELVPVLVAGRVSGVGLASIERGGPAEKAGLEQGDAIVAVGGRPCASARDVERRFAAAGPGRRVRLEVVRLGRARAVDVELGAAPRS